MMLLDTDILIDVALDRRPRSDPASELLDQIDPSAEAAYVAWHAVSNEQVNDVWVPTVQRLQRLRSATC